MATRDSGRQVGSGGTSNGTATSPDSAALQLPDLRVEGTQPDDELLEHAAAGSATGGCRGARPAPRTTVTAWRKRSNRSWAVGPLGGQALGLAGLLEHRPPLGEVASISARRSRAPDSVSRSRSSWAERQLALLDGQPRLLDRLLGDLQPAGVLGALGVQVVERPLELPLGPRRAPVGAADRGLEPVAEGRLVAVEVGQLVVADRRRRAEERLGRDAGQLGEGLVGERRIRDRRRRRGRAGRCPSRRGRPSRACRSGRPSPRPRSRTRG